VSKQSHFWWQRNKMMTEQSHFEENTRQENEKRCRNKTIFGGKENKSMTEQTQFMNSRKEGVPSGAVIVTKQTQFNKIKRGTERTHFGNSAGFENRPDTIPAGYPSPAGERGRGEAISSAKTKK